MCRRASPQKGTIKAFEGGEPESDYEMEEEFEAAMSDPSQEDDDDNFAISQSKDMQLTPENFKVNKVEDDEENSPIIEDEEQPSALDEKGEETPEATEFGASEQDFVQMTMQEMDLSDTRFVDESFAKFDSRHA